MWSPCISILNSDKKRIDKKIVDDKRIIELNIELKNLNFKGFNLDQLERIMDIVQENS